VRPEPRARHYEGWSFRSWEAGLAGLQRLARHELLPDVVRLSDPDETRANLLNAPGGGASLLRGALRTSLGRRGKQPLVMSHVSHAYPTGASLYVTVLADRDEALPIQQWLSAKRAATDALLAAGGTLTHHHAVGADHRPWLERELGPLGVEVLHAVKQRLDPRGICNPGVLLPD
jgi:FAD/FMN-containing dehydrogenase